MTKKVIQNIKEFYETPIENNKTRFQIWEEGNCVGNSMTPSIAYKDYRKKLAKFLYKLLTHTQNNKILSCGCGNAFIEQLLLESKHDILATDICESALEFAKSKGLKTQILNANKKFDFNKNTFDMVFSEGLVGHLLNESLSIKHFLKESKRILKEQGIIFIGNESSSNGEELEFVKRADFYFTSNKYLKEALKKEGFEAVQSLMVPYNRPGEGIKYRIWVWGFKPINKII